MSHSSTVEAMKAAALAKIRAKSGSTPVEAVLEADKAAVVPIVPAEPEWPNVLKTVSETTRNFSELFPKHTKFDGFIDFAVPVFTGYEFPVSLAASIPTDSDYMVDSKLLYDAVLAYSVGSVTHLVGPPGTGKTNGLPVLMAARMGLPLLRLGLNKKGMMLDDLIGREAIKSTDKGMETSHKDGVIVNWIENPCLIILDEFSRANTEMTNGLMSLMERNGVLVVENRTHCPVIKRHPNCWLLAADNVKGLGDQADRMVGTDLVDGAVLDRFEVTLEVDYLPAADQEKLIDTWFPGFPKSERKKIVQFGVLVQDAYKKGLLPLSFSPRSLKEVARYACLHQNSGVAIKKVVVSKYAEESDVHALKNMYRTAFGKELS